MYLNRSQSQAYLSSSLGSFLLKGEEQEEAMFFQIQNTYVVLSNSMGDKKINFDVFYTKGSTTNIENEPHISSSLFSLYTMEITCCLFFYRWRGKEEACIFILSLSV